MILEDFVFDYTTGVKKFGFDLYEANLQNSLRVSWFNWISKSSDQPSFLSGSGLTRHELRKGGLLFIRPRRFAFLTDELGSNWPIAVVDEQRRPVVVECHAEFIDASEWLGYISEACGTPAARRSCTLGWLIHKTSEFLLRMQTKAVVTTRESGDLERVFTIAARIVGIPSVNIQDGVIGYVKQNPYACGAPTDRLVVWGEFFKRRYAAIGHLPKERIHVFGYPYHPLISKAEAVAPPPSLCFLGQSWRLFSSSLYTLANSVVDQFASACKRYGVPFYYRAHPGEARQFISKRIQSRQIVSATETLEQTLSKHQYFAGLTSTALIEAVMVGRTAIQIYDPAFDIDRFDDAGGGCYTCDNNRGSIDDIVRRLASKELTPRPIADDYISVPANPTSDFIAIVAQAIDLRPNPLEPLGAPVCVIGHQSDKVAAVVTALVQRDDQAYGPEKTVPARRMEILGSFETGGEVPTILPFFADLRDVEQQISTNDSRAAQGMPLLETMTSYALRSWRQRGSDKLTVLSVAEPEAWVERSRSRDLDVDLVRLEWLQLLTVSLTNAIDLSLTLTLVFPDLPGEDVASVIEGSKQTKVTPGTDCQPELGGDAECSDLRDTSVAIYNLLVSTRRTGDDWHEVERLVRSAYSTALTELKNRNSLACRNDAITHYRELEREFVVAQSLKAITRRLFREAAPALIDRLRGRHF